MQNSHKAIENTLSNKKDSKTRDELNDSMKIQFESQRTSGNSGTQPLMNALRNRVNKLVSKIEKMPEGWSKNFKHRRDKDEEKNIQIEEKPSVTKRVEYQTKNPSITFNKDYLLKSESSEVEWDSREVTLNAVSCKPFNGSTSKNLFLDDKKDPLIEWLTTKSVSKNEDIQRAQNPSLQELKHSTFFSQGSNLNGKNSNLATPEINREGSEQRKDNEFTPRRM